ncbi:dj-1 family protein [Diplodia corticola]|uniref:Dj-1 family protein n=1 Tax=Diplodia corticola TaxID=236234 RepID=A0A1J9RM41_9PEZI|nr:dj-1 family protein [Diplodia corticola]OJD28988.1 dj-1 family protein [Diplodia corticola]
MSFNLSKPDRKVHAGVILTKGYYPTIPRRRKIRRADQEHSVTEMLDIAPFEFFAWLNKDSLKLLNFPPAMIEEAMEFELHWVTEDGKPAALKSRAQIQPTDSFDSCPPLDIVLMGAHDVQYKMSDAEKAFIRKAYDQCSAFLAICAGTFSLLESGLLEGKTVCPPRMFLGVMRKQAPHVNWVDKRWVRDGKVWSSSTLLNGTDLIRGFAEETWGGRSGMVESLLDASHFPARDVDFKDFHGRHFEVDSFE